MIPYPFSGSYTIPHMQYVILCHLEVRQRHPMNSMSLFPTIAHSLRNPTAANEYISISRLFFQSHSASVQFPT